MRHTYWFHVDESLKDMTSVISIVKRHVILQNDETTNYGDGTLKL